MINHYLLLLQEVKFCHRYLLHSLALAPLLCTNAIIKRASKMLMTGNFSLEAFGLNPTLFDQIEQLTKLNNKVREKYRGCVKGNMQQLETVEAAADE